MIYQIFVEPGICEELEIVCQSFDEPFDTDQLLYLPFYLKCLPNRQKSSSVHFKTIGGLKRQNVNPKKSMSPKAPHTVLHWSNQSTPQQYLVGRSMQFIISLKASHNIGHKKTLSGSKEVSKQLHVTMSKCFPQDRHVGPDEKEFEPIPLQ